MVDDPGRQIFDESAFASRLLAIRDHWNIANHPFYAGFHSGDIGLTSLALLLTQQYHHIVSVLPSLSLIYYKAPPAQRSLILNQLISESGSKGDAEDAQESSIGYILRFCESAGVSRSAVLATRPFPAWRARALFNINVAHEESFATYMAIKSITEGQQWSLNHHLILPALERHGYGKDDPRIDFFTRHFISNSAFGKSQIDIAAAMLPDEASRRHAAAMADETGRLYWYSMNDAYRMIVRGEVDPMPAPSSSP